MSWTVVVVAVCAWVVCSALEKQHQDTQDRLEELEDRLGPFDEDDRGVDKYDYDEHYFG